MNDYKTPGVYIVEKNAFPPSAVAVPTAVPVFVGYTEKAERKGKNLAYVPTKIASMAEYFELFGGRFTPKFVVSAAANGEAKKEEAKKEDADKEEVKKDDKKTTPASSSTLEEFRMGGKTFQIGYKDKSELYFYNCIKFFFLNGGSECYILSVGSYKDVAASGVSAAAFLLNTDASKDIYKILEKEWEPTLIVIPDIVTLRPVVNSDGTVEPGYYKIYDQVLAHCAKTQSRFAVMDVARKSATQTDTETINNFRGALTKNLNYGAAYYPWLKSSVVEESEVDFRNIDSFDTVLKNAAFLIKGGEDVKDPVNQVLAKLPTSTDVITDEAALPVHQSLWAVSKEYKQLINEIRSRINLLPPSAAIAGIYKATDTSRGVWKAPANVGVSSVLAPEVNISHDEQALMNVDPVSGKSINIIRAFPSLGSLVWGARTLDGNSKDWKYINVRRTMIFIEQSLKLATRSFVFEPNDNGTWITLKSMFNGFLYNLWKQGALPGSTPEVAYSVQIGLGVTMTPDDILDGILRVTVLVAIVRPAEFIELTFQQQQQQA